MSSTYAAPGPVFDLDRLYRLHSGRLKAVVRHASAASDVVIEDACQTAWARLLHHLTRVHPDCAFSWLARTAVREVVRTGRRDAREVSLDGPRRRELVEGLPAADLDLVAQMEQRSNLELVALLSERQQRMVWLHALGLTYAEIAASTDATPRTVERQLLRAKRRLRWMAG